MKYKVDFSTREGIMKEWGKWVAYHRAGGGGSWPTDAFESLLDWYEERIPTNSTTCTKFKEKV